MSFTLHSVTSKKFQLLESPLVWCRITFSKTFYFFIRDMNSRNSDCVPRLNLLQNNLLLSRNIEWFAFYVALLSEIFIWYYRYLLSLCMLSLVGIYRKVRTRQVRCGEICAQIPQDPPQYWLSGTHISYIYTLIWYSVGSHGSCLSSQWTAEIKWSALYFEDDLFCRYNTARAILAVVPTKALWVGVASYMFSFCFMLCQNKLTVIGL